VDLDPEQDLELDTKLIISNPDPKHKINYLCTYNSYGVVCSGFDVSKCLYPGKWEGLEPGN